MMLRAPTHTRISLDLSFAELSPEHAKLECDGVGLLRGESAALAIGVHPRKLVKDGQEEKYLDLFARQIVRAAREFAPRPVVYRALDLSSKQYRELQSGCEYEENGAMDLRGCSRYLADEASFRMDLRSAKRARDMGCVNLDVMLPHAGRPEELARCREIVIEEGLFASAEFELWMSVEEAATMVRIDEFLPNVSGVAIDWKGLKPEPGTFPLEAAARAVQAARQHGAGCSIYGAVPPWDAETVGRLIESGVTSFCTTPNAFDMTLAAVAHAERTLGVLPEREIAL